MKLKGSTQDPLWYKDAIIYETHVRAFFDSNGDGVGDFPGLIQKLDYLQELGITCLWLLPFFPSPLRDDGYDISDYTNVHPSYGTLEDFRALLHAAHERGLQVVIELVINHTSDQHPWFQAARKAPPDSPERDFYVWSKKKRKYQEARIIFTDTEQSNWTWDSQANAYYWHRFFSHQPDLNYDNPAVLQEMIRVMQFWLDMGVDGFRLDAVPYLVEREKTNCENLAETHAIIQQIRRALDDNYENRMMLAEANQWPTDVLSYFGNGNECQMAYHFPLMPRIFMALRLEDRHPIVDILTQTPAIPETCQWALFLRNHDELTLEMVTDEERDYMYFAYSADPRMRLNLGIRRRLAPLMENNRRRVELLSSLLLSFPGTPVIYYGDEIGMGDNIYLGDRNGVRTPMQWSPDRNAGFSRANPAKLYSPVIMDPVYGYEAINVEAQQGDSSSLLHWMRNMISLRKLFKVFGRGTIEFLEAANPKVLTYLRRDEQEQILCIANLSRFAQPVTLDLSALAGMTPVEMLGYTEFPTIGQMPYSLTLGPYGFYWFELHMALPPIEMHPEEEAEEVVSIVGGWGALFQGRSQEVLETKYLPKFLVAQRWFGGKAQRIETARVVDWGLLGEEPSSTALTLVEVTYADGNQETYSVPLTVALGSAAEELQRTKPEFVLCRVTDSGEGGVLYDATADEHTCHMLLQVVEQKREWTTQKGVLRAFPTRVFAETCGTDALSLPVSRSSLEQSNTSVLYGNRLILKLFRRLQEGPNPDFEIGRHLTERVGFERIPKLAGALEYERNGSQLATLGILQTLIPNQGDAWKRTLEILSLYYEECSTLQTEGLPVDGRSLLELSQSEIPPMACDALGMYREMAATLGKRTAELHLALATPTDDPAFAPEPLTPADLARLSAGWREHASRVFDELKENLARLPDELVDRAGLVLSRRRQFLECFRALENASIEALKIRIHGDYHLGQLLCVENDYVILDFEGEPARSLPERRTKDSPLKDVAGMLRSFSYAAYSALLAHVARRPGDFDQLRAWAALWERWTSAVFLKAYRETVASGNFLPTDTLQLEELLAAYLLDKAFYELRYELNNRPAWVQIPLTGVLALAPYK